mgnify:CR=1 FL=1
MFNSTKSVELRYNSRLLSNLSVLRYYILYVLICSISTGNILVLFSFKRSSITPPITSKLTVRAERSKSVNIFTYSGRMLLVCMYFSVYLFTCISILFVLCDLLAMLSGDIHPNPGPGSRDIMNVLHLNVNSLTANNKIDELESLCLHNNIDVICLNETKLDKTIADEDIQISGFNLPFRCDRNRAGGGVAIYTSESLNAKLRSDLSIPHLESVIIEMTFNKCKTFIATFYRPPGQTLAESMSFLDCFEELIGNIIIESPHAVIITGDFNLPGISWVDESCSTTFERAFFNTCHGLNLQQLVTEPTRGNSLLDLVFVIKDTINCSVSNFAPISTCDHECILLATNICVGKGNCFKKVIWSYGKVDYDKVHDLLSSAPWDAMFVYDNINDTCQTLTEFLSNVASECIPHKEVTIRPKDKPFMTGTLRHHMKVRDRAYKRAKKSGEDDDWAWYRRLRNEVVDLVRIAKRDYFSRVHDILSNKKTEPKKWWQTLKQACGWISKKPVPSLIDNGSILINSVEKANCFNNYFASQWIKDDFTSELPEIEYKTDQRLDHIIITEDEVLSLLKKLQISKTGGPDGIPNKVLRLFSHYIHIPLTKLFNASLRTSTFPDDWKKANVSALFKKDNPHAVKNYRPVSLLCSVSKVFESCVFNRLYEFLTSHNLLTYCNSGFKKMDSTVNQLINIVHELSQAIDKGKEVRMIFLDISKAFDRVWHRGLLLKLQQVGVHDPLLSWIRSYLSNRKQRVCIEGSFSDWVNIDSGVPQGSVLGPLLFLVFINDLIDDITCKVYLFADDTTLFEIVETPEGTVINFNANLKVVEEWGEKWKVDFNPDKTEEMIISTKKKKPAHDQLSFMNKPILRVNEHKHLGVTLSDNLCWDSHIKHICKKASSRLGRIRSCMYHLPCDALECIYSSYIRPILEYASPIFDNCSGRSRAMLENVQYKASLLVSGAMRTSSQSKILSCLGWPSLAVRRKYHKLVLYYKITHGSCPEHLRALIPRPNIERVNYSLRNISGRSLVYARTSLFINSFIPSSTRLWNALPLSIRNCPSVNIFKVQLKRHLFPARLGYLRQGPRKLNILINRLRVDFSALNAHLFSRRLIENPSCPCGCPSETINHFLLQCPLHDTPRQTLVARISEIILNENLDLNFNRLRNSEKVNLLLFGTQVASYECNCLLVEATMHFLSNTNRFALSL